MLKLLARDSQATWSWALKLLTFAPAEGRWRREGKGNEDEDDAEEEDEEDAEAAGLKILRGSRKSAGTLLLLLLLLFEAKEGRAEDTAELGEVVEEEEAVAVAVDTPSLCVYAFGCKSLRLIITKALAAPVG